MHRRSRSSQSFHAIEEGQAIQQGDGDSPRHGRSSDIANMVLLVVLYAMQGVPLGLTTGSIPFLLKSHASYTEIGVFSLAAYPYSMKLLWSPVVDAIFSSRIGWRKSWVLPIQMVSGLIMIFSRESADRWLETANIRSISILFFIFVLLAATQDIAVDGWALTLLSRENIGHASTCQTIGMNIGYFLSFTIFLALNDANFCNSYFRPVAKEKGILSLSNYFHFWGWFYLIVTFLLIFKAERPHHNASPLTSTSVGLVNVAAEVFSMEADRQNDTYRFMDGRGHDIGQIEDYGNGSIVQNELHGSGRRSGSSFGSMDGELSGMNCWMIIKQMYRRLWAVTTLPNIRRLTAVLLVSKVGSITAEAAGIFKLMEKGVTREIISLVVLIEFPFEILFAIFAGRWASRGRPFSPWVYGYFIRLIMAFITTSLVATFPMGAGLKDAPAFYLLIVLAGVTTSFASTLMFVSQGTFFAYISDSSMGGTYLTLLNTIANFGYAWPKFFVFLCVDLLTFQRCVGARQNNGVSPVKCSINKSLEVSSCTTAGGTCVMIIDGFYLLSVTLSSVGIFIGLWCKKVLHEIEIKKDDTWRVWH